MLSIYVWIWHFTEGCSDLEEQTVLTWSIPALGRRESDWWKILFLSFILHETSCHRRNKRMPLDTSSTGLFFAWEQMLTLMVSAPCSLTPWVLLLRDWVRGSLWLLVGFGAPKCMLHYPVLCRGINGIVRRDAALMLCGLSSQNWKTYCV